MKKALISGISGQDGSYLAELLISKGYEVRHRPAPHFKPAVSTIFFKRVKCTANRYVHFSDVTDSNRLAALMIN